MPIANSGDVNDIPVTTPTGTGQLSFQAGFPFITQVPLLAGGIAPSRPDFNAVMKLLSQHTFFAQSGGIYPWQGADGDFAGLNYLAGWHVLGSNGHEYIAKLPSGPDVPDSGGGFVGPKNPTADDGTYWVDMMDDNDLSDYGTYTARAVLTASGAYVAPVTGWYRVTCIGGGGAGGGRDNYGGLGGGTTTFGTISAPGGGGGGAGATGQGAGGGGAAGLVETGFVHLTQGESVAVSIGAGGLGTTTATTPTGIGAGRNIASGLSGGVGGVGASNGGPRTQDSTGGHGSSGGNGANNGTQYGGGGGGSAGSQTSLPGVPGVGGFGGSDGSAYNGNGAGGNGGNGAVTIEYQGAV